MENLIKIFRKNNVQNAPVCAYFTILFFVYNLMYKHTYMVNFTCSINDILINYVKICTYRVQNSITCDHQAWKKFYCAASSCERRPSRSQMTITLQKPTTGHKKMLWKSTILKAPGNSGCERGRKTFSCPDKHVFTTLFFMDFNFDTYIWNTW